MSTETTEILGAELPGSEGSADKVTRYNEALNAVFESAIAGRLAKSVAGSSNVTLSDAEGRNAIMEFTGAITANISVLLRAPGGTPAGYSSRVFIVYNNTTGAFTLTVKTTAAGSTGIAVTQGKVAILFHNGTNVSEITESGATKGAAFSNGSDSAVAASTTTYNTIAFNSFSTTEALRQAVAPYAQTIRNFRLATGSAQPASGSLVVTLRKNGVDTAVTFTIAAGAAAGTYGDLTHSASFAASDLISWSIVNNATGTSATIRGISMEIDAP